MSVAGVHGMLRSIEYLTRAYNRDDRSFAETIDHRATIRRYRDGVLHCDDEPALEYHYRRMNFSDLFEYYQHRKDAPTVTDDVMFVWYHDGLAHRDDGPALVSIYSNKYSINWCLNDVLYKTRREYLTANPRWRAVTDVLSIGARDPALPIALLDQATIARIALACFE